MRRPLVRLVTDAARSQLIRRVHRENFSVYGARKLHAELRRLEHPMTRCTVERLMKADGLRGVTRAKGPRTTIPGDGPDTRSDLVERQFTAPAPNRLGAPPACGGGVADVTYCKTHSRWVYAAFVIDVYSRRVVGWQLSTSLRTDLALDALEMGSWTRAHAGREVTRVIALSDKGSQYVAIRYTQRLAEAGAVASVGSRRDSYDDALAEAFNSLGAPPACGGVKAELIGNRGPWKNIDDLEVAVAVPPAEQEDHYYRQHSAATTVAASVSSL